MTIINTHSEEEDEEAKKKNFCTKKNEREKGKDMTRLLI